MAGLVCGQAGRMVQAGPAWEGEGGMTNIDRQSTLSTWDRREQAKMCSHVLDHKLVTILEISREMRNYCPNCRALAGESLALGLS